MSKRAHERMCWLLDRMDSKVHSGGHGFAVAWDEDLVDDFLSAFPEAKKTMTVYTIGAPSVPMLNRAAKRAERLGYLRAGVVGNQDARSYNQRTWCRTWRIMLGGWNKDEYEK
jgi:hypothetical protein